MRSIPTTPPNPTASPSRFWATGSKVCRASAPLGPPTIRLCRAAQRRELQKLLTARGYDVGQPDGKIGQKTRDAIKEIERHIGLEQRGRPGGKVLEALRG